MKNHQYILLHPLEMASLEGDLIAVPFFYCSSLRATLWTADVVKTKRGCCLVQVNAFKWKKKKNNPSSQFFSCKKILKTRNGYLIEVETIDTNKTLHMLEHQICSKMDAKNMKVCCFSQFGPVSLLFSGNKNSSNRGKNAIFFFLFSVE